MTKISPCCAAGGDERIYSICKFFCFLVCLLDRGHIISSFSAYYLYFVAAPFVCSAAIFSFCGDSERFAPHGIYYTRDFCNIFFCCLCLYTQMLDRRWDKVAERDFPKCQVFLNLALFAVVHLRKLFSQVYTKQCQIPSGCQRQGQRDCSYG